MITNYNVKQRKEDVKILTIIISVFMFIVWLCTPPGNKFAQLCFYGNNTQFFIAKLTKTKNELNEWVYHRNNAVYLARMEYKSESLQEMNKAVKTVPNYISDREMSALYNDRANLRLFWGEYKEALDDFLRVNDPNLTERLKIALLFKEIGNKKKALSYCNSIVNTDPRAYAGYACMADIYASAGKYDVSVRIYDLLIDRVNSRARYYADRAFYKKQCGDIEGYQADIEKAKEISPMFEEKITILEETINPKRLTLTIM